MKSEPDKLIPKSIGLRIDAGSEQKQIVDIIELRKRGELITNITESKDIASLLRQPEFVALGMEIAEVVWFDNQKGFGFAVVDGHKIFVHNKERVFPVAGIHSVPEHSTSFDDSFTPANFKPGDKIIVSSVRIEALRGGRRTRTTKPKRPEALGWMTVEEYALAVGEIYSREPRIPGVYWEGDGLVIIDKPWSLPHSIDTSRGYDRCVGRSAPVNFENLIKKFPRNPTLDYAKQVGLVGGESDFRLHATELFDDIAEKLNTWELTYRRLCDVESDISEGNGNITLGDIHLQVVDGSIVITEGTYSIQYGWNDDDNYVVGYYKNIGGNSQEDVSLAVWEFLIAIATHVRARSADQGVPSTAEIKQILNEAYKDYINARTSEMMLIVSTIETIEKASKKYNGSGVLCNEMRRLERVGYDWLEQLEGLRNTEIAREALLATEKAEALKERQRQDLLDRQSRKARDGILGSLEQFALRIKSLELRTRDSYPDLIFDDATYLWFNCSRMRYSIDTLQVIENTLSSWEREATKAEEQARIRSDYQPKFEQHSKRLEAIGLGMIFTEDHVRVADVIYLYNDAGYKDFCNSVLVAEQEKRLVDERERIASEEPALRDFGGNYRRSGATGRCDFWVVRADGSFRPGVVSHGRYESQGVVTWPAVGPDEVALAWKKPNVMAEHDFTVSHQPAQITEKQFEAITRLQEQISEEWSVYDGRSTDRRGDRSSPPVGDGWAINPDSLPKELLDKLKLEKERLQAEQLVVQKFNDRIDRIIDKTQQVLEITNSYDFESRINNIRDRLEELRQVGLKEMSDAYEAIDEIDKEVLLMLKEAENWVQDQQKIGVSEDALKALLGKFGR